MMKKNKKIFWVIFVFSILVMIPMFLNSQYIGHDGEFHIANIDRIVSKLSWDNWFVREPLSLIGNNFGYGTRFFYPPLPHLMASYITKFFEIFNIHSVLLGMRITKWITVLSSGFAFYFLAKKITKNQKIATLGSLFYMSVPYFLADIYIRDAFSEMFLFLATPLIILGLLELMDQNHRKFYFCFTLGYVIALYSHMAMIVYLTLMLLCTFLPVYWKQIFTKKNLGILLLSGVSILILTSPFWVMLIQMKTSGRYTIFIPYYLISKGGLEHSTLNLLDYFRFHPHTFGAIRHHLQFIITILLFVSVFQIIKNKEWKNKAILFVFLFFLLSIWMTTKFFPWKYAPSVLQTLQFPWRLTLYVQFGGLLLALLPLKKLSTKPYFSKVLVLGACLCLLATFYYAYHTDKIYDSNQIDYRFGLGNEAEYLPEKTTKNKEYYERREENIVLLKGNAKTKIVQNEVPKLVFEIETENPITIELPRLYYVGYELSKENEVIDLKESENGFLECDVQKSGTYELRYTGTGITHVADILALFTLGCHFGYIIYWKLKKVSE